MLRKLKNFRQTLKDISSLWEECPNDYAYIHAEIEKLEACLDELKDFSIFRPPNITRDSYMFVGDSREGRVGACDGHQTKWYNGSGCLLCEIEVHENWLEECHYHPNMFFFKNGNCEQCIEDSLF